MKLSKTESILLSILFFIILVFMGFIILLLLASNLYNISRLPGLIVLFISGYLTKLFYDKTRIDK